MLVKHFWERNQKYLVTGYGSAVDRDLENVRYQADGLTALRLSAQSVPGLESQWLPLPAWAFEVA